MDGDGDIDFITITNSGLNVYLYTNNGGAFSSKILLTVGGLRDLDVV